MKNLTLTLQDDTYRNLRVAAAREGKSMSRLVGDMIERRVGRPMGGAEAMRQFLSGPSLDLTDEDGKAPSRDQIYER